MRFFGSIELVVRSHQALLAIQGRLEPLLYEPLACLLHRFMQNIQSFADAFVNPALALGLVGLEQNLRTPNALRRATAGRDPLSQVRSFIFRQYHFVTFCRHIFLTSLGYALHNRRLLNLFPNYELAGY
jgi:hypothetical protein